MYDLLFEHATVVCCDEAMQVLYDTAVGVKGGKIACIGAETADAVRKIDASGKVLMPGLINTHTHIPMTLMRGLSDDTDLQDWLHNHIFPTEDRLTDGIVKVGVDLALLEFIASGTTSFSDSYFFSQTVAESVDVSGLKANLARSVTNFGNEVKLLDFYGTREAVELYDRWHKAGDGKILVDAAIHAEYTTSESLWRELGAFAREKDLVMQVHLSETRREHEECIAKYGKTPARLFCDAGVFDAKTLAAHCVHVTDEDLDIFVEKGVSVAHNPMSNLKLASGVARIPEMLARGINVGLGTDGVASNNNADLFEEVKLTACLHKGVSGDPCAITAAQALRCATYGGAVAQGRERECGMVKVGMDADLILVDFTKPHLTPCHNPISNLVYAARGSDVCMTVVRGKILYENGEFTTLDAERILHDFKSRGFDPLFS